MKIGNIKKQIVKLCFATLTIILVTASVSAGDIMVGGKNIASYLPVLEKVKKRILPRDPDTGLYISEVKPDLYVINDGVYLSAFLKTGKGVIVFDAPDSYGSKLPGIIRKYVPDEDIKYLVYSHSHKDHIGGSSGFRDIKGLKILSHRAVSDTIKARQGKGGILVPNVTFEKDYRISLGREVVELSDHRNFHSSDADIFIYMPKQKFLYVIDFMEPGSVPFQNFGMTENIDDYLATFDDLLAYDFDIFLAGHLDSLGNREDVKISRDYVRDVKAVAKKILDTTPAGPLFGKAFGAMGNSDNTFLAFKFYLETIARKCSVQLVKNWGDKLAAVDVWSESHCAIMQNYLRTH